MPILIKGIGKPDKNGVRYTEIFEWCETDKEAIKIVRRALREVNTIILVRKG